MKINYFKGLTFLLLALLIISCTKDESDILNLSETIIVRHKNADMPAYIHGNASNKIFLIILHGGPGGHGLQYRVNSFITDIEKNNAVVYFDQRGSGNAQGSYSKDDVSINLMAEDVLALAHVIRSKYGNDSKLFLLGHSWGGTLGPATLLKNQDLFSGWITVGGAHDPKGMIDKYIIVLNEIGEDQIMRGNSIDHWNGVLDQVKSVGTDKTIKNFSKLNNTAHESEAVLLEDNVIKDNEIELDDDIVLNNPFKFIWNGFSISQILSDKGLWTKVSYTHRLEEINIPSLVLWGKYDLVVPTVFAKEAYDNLGSSDKDLYIFEKSGHSPMFNEPDLFSEKVIDFINMH